MTSSLEDYAKISRLCSLCSRMCRHSCPTHLITRSDACSPVGRALIIELYRGGKSALTEAAVDRLYQCSLCGACRAWCKPRHELPRIIELARERVVKEHRAPAGTLELDNNVNKHSNVYGEPHAKRFKNLQSIVNDSTSNSDLAFFVGCTIAYRHPEIANATYQVLTELNIPVNFLTGEDGEVCCGSPLIRAGFTETAKSLATQNVSAIIQSGAKTVVTTCPGCARTLRQDYTKLGVSLPKKVNVLHITEFLYKHRRELGPKLTKRWNSKTQTAPQKVIYHDPCHLGRELGVYNQPRQLLQLLPGSTLVEFPHNREYADCCGGGGALPKTFPDLAEKITNQRLFDAASLSAPYLVSACPNCKLHFVKNQSHSESQIMEVLDVMEVLARAIKGNK
jgi:Fe-S oxidoreductase